MEYLFCTKILTLKIVENKGTSGVNQNGITENDFKRPTCILQFKSGLAVISNVYFS